MKKPPELYRTDWNGILLEIAYDPAWLPAHITGQDVAHITLTSLYPSNAPLPFRQRTLARSAVDAAGGPQDYVDVMLTAEAAE